jgi:hypothetical protein
MRVRDAVALVVGLSAVTLGAVGFVARVGLPMSAFEILFFAVPVAFVLFLCWQASKYYIVTSDADASEWSFPVDSDADESQADESGPETVESPSDSRREQQTRQRN